MIISEFVGKWMLNLFPPLLFNRIQVLSFEKGYMQAWVRINKSILNRNLNGTIFGGTIFSAADPFYALLFWQIFARRGVKVQTWLKSASIDYKKPGATSLYLHFKLTEQDIADAQESLDTIGKFVRSYVIEITNKQGEICAIATTEVYIRKISTAGQKELSGF